MMARTFRIVAVSLPSFQPLRLGRKPQPFAHPDWVFELKWDGFRSLAYVDGKSRLISRNENEFTSFEALREKFSALHVMDAVIDGEIVCLDENGKADFRSLLFRRAEPVFYAFDLLWLDGIDLRREPLIRRKRALMEILFGAPPEIRYVDHVAGQHGKNFFHLCCAQDLEGIVAKRLNSTYLDSDQESSWLKVKNRAYSQNEGREELFEP